MKVILSKTIGYCHGVSATIKKASSLVRSKKIFGRKIYSIGQLIHNKDVSEGFAQQGLQIIESPENNEAGTALIRAHGIPDKLKQKFLDKGFKLVDSTCTNIIKTQEIIRASKDREIVVLGVKDHAETLCLLGTGKGGYHLVTGMADLEKLKTELNDKKDTPLLVVTQTTFPQNLYGEIKGALEKEYKDIEFGNKLCLACIQRKRYAMELAKNVDAVVVVGGKSSMNTRDLGDYVATSGKQVFFVENTDDFTDGKLDQQLSQFKTVGLVSGTSTPATIISKIEEHLKKLN